MAGLKKVIDGILSDAEKESAELIEAARLQAEEALASVREECAEHEKAMMKKADAENEKHKKQISSLAESEKRRIMLCGKSKIIDTMLDNAYSEILKMPKKEYEALICKMIEQRLAAGECTVYFSESEYTNMSKVCGSKLDAAAQAKQCRITFGARANIRRGFVLCHDGIEENCSFDALYKAYRNILCDRAAEILFKRTDV